MKPIEYAMRLDKAKRALLVTFDEGRISETWETPKIKVGMAWRTDGLPKILYVEIVDDDRLTLIEDWIEEAISEVCGPNYADDYER